MLRRWLSIGVLALAAPAVVVVGACGTDAIGVESCRQIETARCKQAVNCERSSMIDGGVDLSLPVHRGSPATDIDACVRFYHDACLHGLATTADPGAPAVNACIDAINTGDCSIVLQPQTSPACAWLTPPAPAVVVDAAAEAEASVDAGTDTSTGIGLDAAAILDALGL